MAFMVFSPGKNCKRKERGKPRQSEKSEMIVSDDGGDFLVDKPCGLRPRGSLPIVFAFFLGNPRRQRLVQIIRQRVNVRLIHFAKIGEFAIGFFTVMELHSVLGEGIADVTQILLRQTIVRQRFGRGAEHLREIDDGVPRDGKSKLGLFFTCALNSNHDERASVQYRRQRSDPRLVVMLRAKIREHRIGEVALHQLGAPKLPIFEEDAERVQPLGVGMAKQQFAGGWRCAGAGIEKGDIDLALGERAVDERQVANDCGKKTETEAGFQNDQRAGQAGTRNDVAQDEGEKSRPAEINIRQKTGLATRHYHGGAGTILHEAETEHEANGPNPYKNKEGKRAIKT